MLRKDGEEVSKFEEYRRSCDVVVYSHKGEKGPMEPGGLLVAPRALG